MQPEERDPAYLWDMLSAASEVRQIVGEGSFEQFQSDIVAMRATERCLEIIGEAARRVSETFRQAHPEISWSEIIGQRNILAHEYGLSQHSRSVLVLDSGSKSCLKVMVD